MNMKMSVYMMILTILLILEDTYLKLFLKMTAKLTKKKKEKNLVSLRPMAREYHCPSDQQLSREPGREDCWLCQSSAFDPPPFPCTVGHMLRTLML